MQTLYTALLGIHALIGGMVGLSTLATLAGAASGPGLKPGEFLVGLAIVLVLTASGYWAWTLRAAERLGAAVLVLAAVWVVAIVVVLIAASTARWN